jgi:hypothetical protein
VSEHALDLHAIRAEYPTLDGIWKSALYEGKAVWSESFALAERCASAEARVREQVTAIARLTEERDAAETRHGACMEQRIARDATITELRATLDGLRVHVQELEWRSNVVLERIDAALSGSANSPATAACEDASA